MGSVLSFGAVAAAVRWQVARAVVTPRARLPASPSRWAPRRALPGPPVCLPHPRPPRLRGRFPTLRWLVVARNPPAPAAARLASRLRRRCSRGRGPGSRGSAELGPSLGRCGRLLPSRSSHPRSIACPWPGANAPARPGGAPRSPCQAVFPRRPAGGALLPRPLPSSCCRLASGPSAVCCLRELWLASLAVGACVVVSAVWAGRWRWDLHVCFRRTRRFAAPIPCSAPARGCVDRFRRRAPLVGVVVLLCSQPASVLLAPCAARPRLSAHPQGALNALAPFAGSSFTPGLRGLLRTLGACGGR